MYLAYSVLAERFLPNIIFNTRPALYKLYILTGQLVSIFGVDVLANQEVTGHGKTATAFHPRHK